MTGFGLPTSIQGWFKRPTQEEYQSLRSETALNSEARTELKPHRVDERTRLELFEELALPHLDALHNFARWLMRNDDEAKEVVQESPITVVLNRTEVLGAITVSSKRGQFELPGNRHRSMLIVGLNSATVGSHLDAFRGHTGISGWKTYYSENGLPTPQSPIVMAKVPRVLPITEERLMSLRARGKVHMATDNAGSSPPGTSADDRRDVAAPPAGIAEAAAVVGVGTIRGDN